MTVRLRVILIIIFAIFLLFLIDQVKNRKVNIKYMLSWFLLDLALIVLTIFPNLLIAMTNALGIYSPVNMIFFCGFLFSLLIIYRLTVAVSKLANQVRTLSQKMALMEDERARGADGKTSGVEHAKEST